MRYGMVIDLARCIGCHTCSVACRYENNLPTGIWWNRVHTEGGAEPDTPRGAFPNLTLSWLPVTCQHCGDPACTKVCPTGAAYKDEETGVVHQNGDACIGCRECLAACPYPGVRSFNQEEPKYAIGSDFGDADAPRHRAGIVEKCTFCQHRLARGEQPACMEACPQRARFWGDLDDPHSEVSRLLKDRSSRQLLVERSTESSTYYLG